MKKVSTKIDHHKFFLKIFIYNYRAVVKSEFCNDILQTIFSTFNVNLSSDVMMIFYGVAITFDLDR